MKRAPRTSQAGFTLIELMISLVLFSFAVAGVMSIAVVTSRSFKEQRRAIQTENAARAPLDFLVDALRGASPGAPSGIIGDGDNCVSQTAIVITDNTTAPDEIDVIYASGGVVTTLYADFDYTTDTELTIPAAQLANFAVGDYVLLTDTSMGTLLRVDGVTTTGLTVSPDNACAAANVWPAGGYLARSLVIRATHAHFSIADLDGIPTLWMDPDGAVGGAVADPVAEGVEDMQVAIGMDTDDSGTLTDDGTTGDEWTGNANGDALPGTGSIRAVKVVLVARDATPLPGTASFRRPAALNRGAATADDNYRRRSLFSTVEIRNLTGSP